VLTDAKAYAALYRAWKLCWQAPPVDFSRHVVVAFLLPTAGCEAELVGFDLSVDGRLSPRVALLGEMCNQVEVAQRFIAAIPRASLPLGGVRLDVGAASDSARWPARAAQANVAPPVARDPRTSGPPVADVALPERGEARLERLPDGALVFVVHGSDGEPSAVSAWVRSPALPEAPERPNVAGLFFPVRWSRGDGRFFSGWSYYDAHGINVTGVQLPSLDAYAVRRSGDRLLLFGPPAPAQTLDVADPVRRSHEGAAVESFSERLELPVSTLAQALRAPEGALLHVSADVVRIGADPRVRLCELARGAPDRLARCAREGAWIEDARVVPAIENPHAERGLAPDVLGANPKLSVVAEGPVLAQRTARGFARVRLLRYALRAE
jgi:hypothetical protein